MFSFYTIISVHRVTAQSMYAFLPCVKNQTNTFKPKCTQPSSHISGINRQTTFWILYLILDIVSQAARSLQREKRQLQSIIDGNRYFQM